MGHWVVVSSSIWRRKELSVFAFLPMSLSVPKDIRSSLEAVGSTVQPGPKWRVSALGDLYLLEAELC